MSTKVRHFINCAGPSGLKIPIRGASSIGSQKPIATSDWEADTDSDARRRLPATLSGYQVKSTSFADGYLIRFPEHRQRIANGIFLKENHG